MFWGFICLLGLYLGKGCCWWEFQNYSSIPINWINPRRYTLLPSLSQYFVTKQKVLHCIWTEYEPDSHRRRTSTFCFRYLDNSTPLRKQGIRQKPKRHTRLFQAFVSWGVFLGKKHALRGPGHLHRHKWHKVSKVKNDHRSKFSNLSNWKEEAWKKIKASTGFEPVTSAIPVRCSTNWAMKPHIAHSSVGKASHRYRGGHGFESRWSLDFFQASSFQLLKLGILLRWSFFTLVYNRSSNIWIISYILHIIKWVNCEADKKI